jgi:photosystem II stability/assembly factor-like uncharacterized protein
MDKKVVFLLICLMLQDLVGLDKWEPVGLCGGGTFGNPASSPLDSNFMIVESDMGGVYISYDSGNTWSMVHYSQIQSSFRAGPPVFHPKDVNCVIKVGSGYSANKIYITRDKGKTWQLYSFTQPKFGVIRRMYIDPDDCKRLIVGDENGNFYKTFDEGKSWNKCKGVSGSPFWISADRSSSLSKRIYFIGTKDGFFISNDNGDTFQRKTNGLPDSILSGFAVGSNKDLTILYAAAPCRLEGGKLTGGVFVSKDRGETWVRKMNPKINCETKRSSEWAAGDLPQYSHFLTTDKEPKRAYVWCRGTSFFSPYHATFYRTDDAGESWYEIFFWDPRDKNCNTYSDWLSLTLGQHWPPGCDDANINPENPDIVMEVDGMFFYMTKNGGKTWEPVHAKLKEGSTEFFINNGLVDTTTWNYYIDPHDSKRHYIAYTDIGFARSEDGGISWRWWGPTEDKRIPVPDRWGNTVYQLAFDPEIPGKIWGCFSYLHDVPNENSIWRVLGKPDNEWPGGVAISLDYGIHWKPSCAGLSQTAVMSIILDSKSPKGNRTLYCASYGNGVFKSVDDGRTWIKKSKGLGSEYNMRVVQLRLHSDGTLFALITGKRSIEGGPFSTDGVGLYRSKDGGENWEKVNLSKDFLYPRDFMIDSKNSNIIYITDSDTPGAGETGGLYRSLDGGKTWDRILRKRKTHFGAYLHPNKEGWIYATGCGWSESPEGGLWLSKDNGKTWISFPELPFSNINRVCFNPKDDNIIYVTTFGGSVWKGPSEP